MGGCVSVSNKTELNSAFKDLIVDANFRGEKGHICSTFVQMNKGATNIIMKNIMQ
jgi:3-deoxy-D-manno-octulosonic-acid transferase